MLRNEWELASHRWLVARDNGWELAGHEASMSGILLALVREAWDDPGAHSYRLVDGRWATLVAVKDRSEANGRLVNTADGPRWLAMYIGETEADSRVSALEAAPKAVHRAP